MDNLKYWDSFFNKEEKFYDKKNRRYLKKGYLHFDNRIWFPDFAKKFRKILSTPNNIIEHSFYPFLQIIVETKRIRLDKEKGKRIKGIKKRPISYGAHFDSLIYSFYSSVLDNLYERYLLNSTISDSVLAYRPLNKSNIEFAHQIFESIKTFENQYGDTSVIALDIKGFFDNLNHNQIKIKWLNLLQLDNSELMSLPKDHFRVYKSLTHFAYVDKDELLKVLKTTPKRIQKDRLQRLCSPDVFRNIVRQSKIIKSNSNSYGIPQGSPISAILSNIYMIDYDEKICELKTKFDFIYKRYCDDILLICKTTNLVYLREQLYGLIKHYGLEIQSEKEDVVIFSKEQNILKSKGLNGVQKRLQYLGFEFDGINTYIRSSSMSKYHRKMRAGVKETIKRAYGHRSQGDKIFKKKLYNRYTHLGSQNFITYALRSSEIMGSDSIRKQISKHFNQLKQVLVEKRNKHESKLIRKGKFVRRMK